MSLVIAEKSPLPHWFQISGHGWVLPGSVLDPLLFLLFVNDLSSCSKKLAVYLFAYDPNKLILYSEFRSLESTSLLKETTFSTSNNIESKITEC